MAAAFVLCACGGTATPAGAPAVATDGGGVGAVATDAGTGRDAAACVGSSAQPSPRGSSAGVVDPATGFLWVFGGDSGPPVMCMPSPVFQSDTWHYDPVCDVWGQVQTTVQPSPRARMAYALDTRRRRMVIFGGRAAGPSQVLFTPLGDVWALDLATGTWQELATTGSAPLGRANASAVYDPTADEMVVFGGNTDANALAFSPQNDTYALNLGTLAWRTVTDPSGTAPPAREFHAAAVNGHAMLVVSGGDANAFTGPFLADAWSLDLPTGVWTNVPLSSDPAQIRRIDHGLTPDAHTGWLLVAGHDDGTMGNRNDVVRLLPDGTQTAVVPGDTLHDSATGFCSFPTDFTTQDANAPERRSAFVMAPDPAHGRALVYGGETDCGAASDVWSVDLGTGAWHMVHYTTDGLSCERAGRTGCTSLCE